jgi:hypothetical protein
MAIDRMPGLEFTVDLSRSVELSATKTEESGSRDRKLILNRLQQPAALGTSIVTQSMSRDWTGR